MKSNCNFATNRGLIIQITKLHRILVDICFHSTLLSNIFVNVKLLFIIIYYCFWLSVFICALRMLNAGVNLRRITALVLFDGNSFVRGINLVHIFSGTESQMN